MVKEYKPRVGSLGHRIYGLEQGDYIWTDRVRTANSEIQRINLHCRDRHYTGKGYTAVARAGADVAQLIRIRREK